MSYLHDPEIATFMLEHARDILLVIDREHGGLIDVNAAAETGYGYSRDELLARTIFDLRATDPQVAAVQMTAADDDGILFQAVHVRRDGTPFPVEVNSRGVTIGGRRRLLSVVRDITDRRRLEAERAALTETTQRALETRDEFLIVASHELRSPVTNVSLKLQQLVRQLERSEQPALLGAARSALVEVTRLSQLISALLHAQAARGEIVLARGPLDLGELIRDVTARLRTRADAAAAQVLIDMPVIRGRWDRLRLDQVFTNLLSNAHKYGRGRPIHVVGHVDGAVVEVEVRDQGIGISAEDAARIFDKFERAVPPAYGGLGLGLYITRQLVEAHGGTIALSSVPGEGSTFRVTLPVG